MEELVRVINDIQYSNYRGDKGFLCKAVQEYYKILESAQVVKPKKEAKKAVKKTTKKPKPTVVIGEQGE